MLYAQGFRRALIRDTGTFADKNQTTDEESQGQQCCTALSLESTTQLTDHLASKCRNSKLACGTSRSVIVRWSSVRNNSFGRSPNGAFPLSNDTVPSSVRCSPDHDNSAAQPSLIHDINLKFDKQLTSGRSICSSCCVLRPLSVLGTNYPECFFFNPWGIS